MRRAPSSDHRPERGERRQSIPGEVDGRCGCQTTGKSDAKMLVLSRKVDQTIVIQGNITIKILEINGDRVKIGISAPRSVVILRQELTEEIKKESADATPRTPSANLASG